MNCKPYILVRCRSIRIKQILPDSVQVSGWMWRKGPFTSASGGRACTERLACRVTYTVGKRKLSPA